MESLRIPGLDIRQGNHEGGTDTLLAVNRNIPTVKADDLLHHRKSDPVAFRGMGKITLIKAVKYVLTGLLAHSATVIQDMEDRGGA